MSKETSARFDHFLCYVNAMNIDDFLKGYAALGFGLQTKTIRHDPGLRNGFVHVGPEYLEFLWVEDEALFSDGEAEDLLCRKACRPFCIGMIADDVKAVHDDWTERGYQLPEVWSKAPRDATIGSPPVWSFQEVPNGLLPGIASFILTYHTKPKATVRKVRVAPNTVYAIDAVTFVATDTEAQAVRWRDVLAPQEAVTQAMGGHNLSIGPHRARWISAETYQANYGETWKPAPDPCGNLALVHLLATDLRKVEATMEQGGRQTVPILEDDVEQLLVPAGAHDGFAFLIQQKPAELWLRERVSLTSEKLELEHLPDSSVAGTTG